jgi:hypothetical protein
LLEKQLFPDMKAVYYYFCLTCFLLVAFPQLVRAQTPGLRTKGNAFSKGTTQFTATYGYGQGELVKNRSVSQIQAGYYVADRLMIGLTGSLMKEWLGEIRSNNRFSGGPLIRYQFTGSRLSPFVALAYQLGKPVMNPTANQAIIVTPGVNFALVPAIRLEASYSLLFVPVHEQVGQAQIGATVLFGSRR